MFGAPGRARAAAAPAPGTLPGLSMMRGTFQPGVQALPPGARVPIIQSPGMGPGGARGPLDAAMAAGPAGTPPGAPAAPAAPGQGIPPQAPAPDTGLPQRPTGGPLLAAMQGAAAGPPPGQRRPYLGGMGWSGSR